MWVLLAVAAAAAILWYRDAPSELTGSDFQGDFDKSRLGTDREILTNDFQDKSAALGIDKSAALGTLGIDKSAALGIDKSAALGIDKTRRGAENPELDDEACARKWIASLTVRARNIFPSDVTLVDAVRIVRTAGWPMPPCVERFAARVLSDSALDDEACARTWVVSHNIFPYDMSLVDAVRIARNAGWPMPPCVERFAARVL